jgi:AcrR family transcriptional regulator
MPAKPKFRPRNAADHRTRVGRERRARTRLRIVEAALRVFAEKGPDAPVIEDFIQAAEVARGTFYNHFRTTEELLTATSNWLENDLMTAIETVNGRIEDPVQRLATGIRLWLHLSRGDAVFCAFLVRSRFRGRIVERHLGRDLGGGLESGRLAAPSLELARDLVVGAVREAQVRMMGSRVSQGYPEDVARLILRALRADERRIESLLRMPLPEVTRKPRVGAQAARPRPRRLRALTAPSTPA